jgi:hypothetical protein
MSEFYIYPYIQASEGAKALAEELDGKRILREGSKYRNKKGDVIINWGASDCPYPNALNADIRATIDKAVFFKRLAGRGLTPKFTDTKAAALGALSFPIFCRTLTQGHDGEGIVVADNADQIVPAKLYVEGINKTSEYRIHVGRLTDGTTSIIGSQKKVHENIEGTDSRVWVGESTRFIWKVDGLPVVVPTKVMDVVKEVFTFFPELTFGAFDVVYDSVAQRAYVIEINSAPMKSPETTRRYGEFFKKVAPPKPSLTIKGALEVALTLFGSQNSQWKTEAEAAIAEGVL